MITWVGLISLTSNQQVFAEQPPANVLSISNGYASLESYTTFYDPGMQDPELADIVQMPDTHWAKLHQRSASMVLHSRHAIWYRIPVQNDSSETLTLLLHDSSPLTDIMSSYLCLQPNDVNTCKKNSKNPNNKNLQNLSLTAGQSATLLIESIGFHSLFFTVSLKTQNTFTSDRYTQRLYFGLLNGILCGLAIYSLLIAIKTKQKAYFAYYVFCSCMTGTFIIHQDFFYAFFGITPNTWLTNISVIMPMVDGVSLAYFIGYYIYANNVTHRVLKTLKLYTSAIVGIATAFLLNAPTVFLVPTYITATLLTISYFIFLCLTERKQPRIDVLLLCLGSILPFATLLIATLTAIGAIQFIKNFLITMQSLEVISSILFASSIIFSIKALQNRNELQIRIAEKERITSDVHNNLLSHLNHELRTPLNGILGASEILMHKSHLPKDRRIFSMIYHTALPLKHLIEDMVNIKSITKNQKSLEKTRFDLHSLLQECMDIFLLTAHDKQIRLYFCMDNNVTSDITTDANRLRQILINLLGNACKFTSNGTVGLHVSQKDAQENNEHTYHFEIIDTGRGVNESDEKKLFEIFESGQTNINPKGTGVGLSIVRKLSEMMGGDCGYRKNTPCGSIFWFSIKVTTHHNTSRKTHSAFDELNILLADRDKDLTDSIYRKIVGSTKKLTIAKSEQEITQIINNAKDYQINTGKKYIDIAIIHSPLADSNTINAILSADIPLLVYEDYDEITNLNKTIKPQNGYEIITRKLSVENFSLNIAEAIIKKDNIIHKYQERNDGRKNSILIAEDIPTNQIIIEEIIKSIGLSSVTCSNGKQAFETFTQHHQAESAFSIVIMDCEMPVMDGFESTEKIRLYEKSNQLTPAFIIALSAHAEPEYRLRSKQSGMDLYLTKPISADILIQHIEDYRRSLA